MYICILDSNGQVKFHKDVKTKPDALLKAIKPYMGNLVVAVECMFCWYWVADFCEENNIKFILGHATDFNPKYALDEVRFWHFLGTTQPDELAKIQRSTDWKLKLLTRYDRMVKKNGVLHVLRKGLGIDDAHFTLLYSGYVASSGQTVKDNFNSNEFSVSRQRKQRRQRQSAQPLWS